MYRVGIYVYFVHFYLRTAHVIRSDTRQQTLAHVLMPRNPIFNGCKRQSADQKQCILPFFNLSLSPSQSTYHSLTLTHQVSHTTNHNLSPAVPLYTEKLVLV
jgi:hypothetical protein